jgi:hypothetical protein
LQQASTLWWIQVRTNALYAKNHILVWNKWLMRIMRPSFQRYCLQNPTVMKQTLSSFITY